MLVLTVELKLFAGNRLKTVGCMCKKANPLAAVFALCVDFPSALFLNIFFEFTHQDKVSSNCQSGKINLESDN